MVARVTTVAFHGIEARPVDVQVQLSPGLPAFSIVGLPDKAVAESRERVRSALIASGLALPLKRITVNLAPADLPKEGSHYDLPIALAIMSVMGVISQDHLRNFVILGELSLDGGLSPVAGVLPTAIMANELQSGLICPEGCGSEAAWADQQMLILAPSNLISLINHFNGRQTLNAPQPLVQTRQTNHQSADLKHIRGQESAKRALEVAASGGHNLLMSGPPGAGKSMLAACLPTILPPLTPRELLDVSMIASVAGRLANGIVDHDRPFRTPHHSASMPALVGGGTTAQPGEISLAHHGVLFLDELPEFSPQVLDALRQPLETGEVSISRVNRRVTYPARFQLVAAMNPCRCGHAHDLGHACKRGRNCAADYQSRISGPLLDRIDIHLDIPPVMATDLMGPSQGESSAHVAERVNTCRSIQTERYSKLGLKEYTTNATCPASLLEDIVRPDEKGMALLRQSADRMHLSARAFYRVLRLARTLADMVGEGEVGKAHIGEALSYRLRLEGLVRAA